MLIWNSYLKVSRENSRREQRKELAAKAFEVVAGYDLAIHEYFNPGKPVGISRNNKHLRYGENPHQQAFFEGDWESIFKQLNGKEISYNNLVDIDAAIQLIGEFEEKTVFAIIKHTNVCGIASRKYNPGCLGSCVGRRSGKCIWRRAGVQQRNRPVHRRSHQ